VRRVARGLAVLVAVVVVAISSMGAASAKPKPPVTCTNPSAVGICVVHVGSPGQGGYGGSGGPAAPVCETADGSPVSCQRPGLGVWDSTLDCYMQLMNPQPPKSSPVWQGHKNGAIYACTAWPLRSTGEAEIWLPASPGGVDPGQVAAQAEKTLNLPRPSGHRSPGEGQRFEGSPFTYVNLWTWFWTDPSMWRSRSAAEVAHIHTRRRQCAGRVCGSRSSLGEVGCQRSTVKRRVCLPVSGGDQQRDRVDTVDSLVGELARE
jgi:hypothetical protein